MAEKKKKVIIKEFNIARVFAIICMVAVHTEFAIYNYNNEVFAKVIDYLGSPFAAPIFMFILGANIILSSHSTYKQLLVRGITMFSVSIVFNIICHALPFFMIDYKQGIISSVENSLHWVFAVDILTFAGLAFIFFAFVKKYKLSNKTLCLIAILASIANTLLVKYCQVDFEAHPIIAFITSLFYNSSITGYFSFFSWIIFPIAGYIFIQILLKVKDKDKDKFYKRLGIICTLSYIVMVIGSLTIFKNSPLLIYEEEYSYYQMNLYSALGNIFFCLGWLSILYFVSKVIPKSLDEHIHRFNKNLTSIYLDQWFLINFLLVLPFNGKLKVNELLFIIMVINIIVMADLLAVIRHEYQKWKKNIIENNL